MSRSAVICALVLCLAGCASTPRDADVLFRNGAYEQAVPLYEAYLREHAAAPDADRTLFRLAVAEALRTQDGQTVGLGSPKALAGLRRLLEDYPNSELVPAAQLLLASRQDLERQRANLRERIQVINQLVNDTVLLQESLEKVEDQKAEELAILDEQLEAVRSKLRAQQAEIRSRGEQIDRLERELEQLKRIDTGQAEDPPQ